MAPFSQLTHKSARSLSVLLLASTFFWLELHFLDFGSRRPALVLGSLGSEAKEAASYCRKA